MEMKEIALLEEERISEAVGEIARFKYRLEGGGIACRGNPGEWINCAYGVGTKGIVSPEEFRKLISWYEEHGIETRFELNPFVDQQTIVNAGEAGFRLHISGIHCVGVASEPVLCFEESDIVFI